ncbi:hypothetical protein ACQKWADRAFT_41894 [Trichoderma austrokoningii]
MADQGMPSPQNGRKKRARTGCLRCRTRRRKCDERKPRCQRCLDADAECIYGPRLSFLQKNAITAPDIINTALDGKCSGTQNYSKIQFVDGEHIRPKDASPCKRSQALNTSINSPEGDKTFICDNSSLGSDLEAVTSSTPIKEPPNFYSGPNNNACHEDDTTVAKSMGPKIPSDSSPHHHKDSQDQSAMRQGDGFNIALDALMTLGAGDHTPVHVTLDTAYSTGDNSLSTLSMLKTIDNIGPVSRRVADQLSMGQSIELLRHYRYKIAPWLDIYDTDQTFGLVVPHLAMRSDLSFNALLELCAASYKIHHDHMDFIERPTKTHTNDVTHPMKQYLEQFKPWEVNLWSILAATEKFLTESPQSWEDALSKNSLLYKTFLESSSSNVLNTRMLWLLARLGTAAALVKESCPLVNSSILGSLLQTSQRGLNDEPSGYYAHEALTLCVQVLEFSFGDQDVTSSFDTELPTPRPVRWISIVDKLSDWYTNRPPIFRPVIELDDGKTSFPVIYYTNGAATFANQLYHTAMMLILTHKPKTVQPKQRRTPSLSQLWHARRICSIAINNNRCECWDPCLLASFYVAARRMTHESQHKAALNGFEQIGALGWPVNSFVDGLKGVWDASELPAEC